MFKTTSPYEMIDVAEAWRRMAAELKPLAPITRSLREALGHVLAEPITAAENMPPFPASAMDGYAVIAEDESPRRRVIGEQNAGLKQPLFVAPGTAARIMTGAPLPDGADAVVPVEATATEGDYVVLKAAVRSGDYIRPVGQDLKAGDIVLNEGIVLGPPEIGLLATVGRTRALVYPRPIVAIMATGDELVPPGRTPGPGQIRDSNSYALVAAVEAAGFEALPLGLIRDDEKALREALLAGVSRADAVITSGGVSMGARDLIKPLLEELGTVHFGRVAMKPGKPLTFATIQGIPIFGLPGFPVSSLVSFENFVRPALRLMAGQKKLWRPVVEACAAHEIRRDAERLEFQRAVVTQRDGEYWAETTGIQASGRLKSLVGANALLRIAPGPSAIRQGDTVRAILIDQPETSETRDDRAL